MSKPVAPGLRRATIARALAELGVEPGDLLLTHSSLSSMGPVVGGAPTVIAAILEALAPDGTAVFPTLTGAPWAGGNGALVFDPARSECWTGRIPEAARARPDALRSRHPTHSVCAIGPLADRVTRDHEHCETPCGWGSPYDILQQMGGRVLFIGVDLACNTMLHHVEETAGVSYVCTPEPVPAHIVEQNGWRTTVRLRLHVQGPRRDYPKLEPELLERGILRLGQIGAATARLVDARPMVELLRPRVAADPGCILWDPSAVNAATDA